MCDGVILQAGNQLTDFMAGEITEKTSPAPANERPLKKPLLIRFVDSIWGQVAGIAAVLGSGAIVARDQIGKASFRILNTREAGLFAALQKKRDSGIALDVEKAIEDGGWKASGSMKAVDVMVAAGGSVDVVPIVEKHNEAYETAFQKLKKEHFKIDSIYKEWRTLRTHQRREVAFTVLGATAIALGAVLAIAAARQTGLQQEELEKRHRDRENGQKR